MTPLAAPSRTKAVARQKGSPWTPYWQAAPLAIAFLVFFVLPLLVTFAVSFWNYTEYSIEPAFVLDNYVETFDVTTLRTYLSTLRFCVIVWAITLVIGFTISYYITFEVRTTTMRIVLALVCTIPFWTSNVIRMISWIPLLGRNGLVNQGLQGAGIVNSPIEWLLFSEFSVILAFVHLNTFFMITPIFNSMMRIDRALIEAAYDGGASGWQTLWNVIVPLTKPGIVIGSIFVLTVVMGDFITIGVMGGQQIASAGKMINTHMGALQFPPAAAHAVILLGTVLVIIWGLTRILDIRKEL